MANLEVTVEHLWALAEKQGAIATAIRQAADVTGDAVAWIGLTHGLVCAPTTAALAVAERMRSLACEALQRDSLELRNQLQAAASAYNNTDSAAKDWLDGTMCR